jgi:hypothetical protein
MALTRTSEVDGSGLERWLGGRGRCTYDTLPGRAEGGGGKWWGEGGRRRDAWHSCGGGTQPVTETQPRRAWATRGNARHEKRNE